MTADDATDSAPADATFSSPDIKPRSRQVTDGLGATVSRGMLRAVGMGDDDWVKPQIGIASSWNEITPCNLSLDRLAQSAKEGRSEEHTSELQSRGHLVCRLLLEKK